MTASAMSIDLTWSAARLARATQGHWVGVAPKLGASAQIVTDTRKIKSGDIFLALKGQRFDAHDFIDQAVAAGARAVVVSRVIDHVDIPQLHVLDTHLALGHLGADQRAALPHLQVVALTGSSGKTTTKEMLGQILSLSAPTLMTRGNLNNDLGVPMMLLELTAQHQYAVMELGANHVGEIAYTTQLVKPQVAAVLNIGTAHVGEFGGREGIAQAKSEIFTGLDHHGVAVFATSGDFIDVVGQAAAAYQRVRFGHQGDVWADAIELLADRSRFNLCTADTCIAVELPFAGRHNIDNALAAAACARALGISLADIAAGLSQTAGVKGRLAFSKHGQLTVIDDTYNANPHSMRAAASVLCAQAGTRIMITGDIAELGDVTQHEHHELGAALAALPIDHLLSVGQYAADVVDGWHRIRATQAAAYTDKAALLADLNTIIGSTTGDIALLFKGSRSATIETLIDDLLETR